ncbi:MAG: bactofilin family protein [Bacillota bacterium]|jgi:cytoskeletal protein CcmA (bactofilin family)|nr:polymer-forming cytoskeletal protein [Candidatus Fermentithermobacillaceae bacterium]
MFRSKEPVSRGGAFESLLGKGIEIQGTLASKGSLRVDGKLQGKLYSDCDIMIGHGAVVKADIDAANVTIAGDVVGNVKCTGRLELLSSGKLRGDITVGSLVISEGAVFSGVAEMTKPMEIKGKVAPDKQREN